MSVSHLFALEEAPHIEAGMPLAEDPDRSVHLRCTLCETAATFDSAGMTSDRVREVLVSFAMEHEVCTVTAMPTARELARQVEQDHAVVTLRRRVEALEEEARGLARECECSPFAAFTDWQKVDRMARTARALLTAERLAVQRKVLDEWKRRLHDAVEREAAGIREIS